MSDREIEPLQLNEQRSQSYQRELAAFLDSVTDGDVRLGDRTISITAEAARSLGLR